MLTARRSLIALVAVCAALALNGLVLGPLWLVTPGEFSDTVASPAYAYSQRISWALLTVLIVLLPAVLGLAGRRGTPPAWVVPLAQGALAMQAATHFVQGFVLPWLEPLAPEVLNLTEGGLMQIMMFAIQGFYLVAMTTVGVTLWRAGHSPLGSVLMILGAVVTPGVGPIGHGIFAMGLLVITVRALRSRTVAPESEAVPVMA